MVIASIFFISWFVFRISFLLFASFIVLFLHKPFYLLSRFSYSSLYYHYYKKRKKNIYIVLFHLCTFVCFLFFLSPFFSFSPLSNFFLFPFLHFILSFLILILVSPFLRFLLLFLHFCLYLIFFFLTSSPQQVTKTAYYFLFVLKGLNHM